MTANPRTGTDAPPEERIGTDAPPEERTGTDAPPGAPPYRVGRARSVLRVVAIASCLPYIGLKTAWMAGSRLGIPDGSPLLDGGTALAVANGATVLMDGGVVVLALLLTRPWGLRVPAWLLVLPMWVASGLLLPIMTAYPVQLVVRLLGGGGPVGEGRSETFLETWVFGVVYGGFIVQGLALGSLFALYARERWGHLWRGRLRDLPATPTAPALRATAVAAASATLVPGVTHLLWATGSTAGLEPARAADRTSDFYVLEAVSLLFVVVTAVGGLLLAFRRTGGLSLRLPLVLAWCGSAQMACWGGWLSLAALMGAGDAADRPTAATTVTYAVQMLAGALVVTLGAYFLAERAAASALSARGELDESRGS
ncbi:hypothetical protein [Streptomyces sp. SH5]|uniref:hypothetical protein n=1 Tax=Streptomyces sp. SH5 TaxID=3041765 RepID=UPI0024780BA0|nr:hypothetical protein [Streptomyces sp. SH5]WGP09390.1 hypothetical protein QFA72_06730 [Streptomyces sp. SH5]